MNEQAKAARREYKRQWARNNPEKVRQYQQKYWERKAAEAEPAKAAAAPASEPTE